MYLDCTYICCNFCKLPSIVNIIMVPFRQLRGHVEHHLLWWVNFLRGQKTSFSWGFRYTCTCSMPRGVWSILWLTTITKYQLILERRWPSAGHDAAMTSFTSVRFVKMWKRMHMYMGENLGHCGVWSNHCQISFLYLMGELPVPNRNVTTEQENTTYRCCFGNFLCHISSDKKWQKTRKGCVKIVFVSMAIPYRTVTWDKLMSAFHHFK